MNDEERQLRNLDKLEYMSQYLTEDHILTQKSLKSAQLVKEDSNLQMKDFDKKNQQELEDLEKEVRKLNTRIDEQKFKQQEIKENNQNLLKAINSNRENDTPIN